MRRPLPQLAEKDENSPTTSSSLPQGPDGASPTDPEQIGVGFELHLNSGKFDLENSSSNDLEILEELHLRLSGGRGVRKVFHKPSKTTMILKVPDPSHDLAMLHPG